MSKLVLIDGNAILHRAYHALPPLTTRSGEPINAVYGLVSMLLRIIQDLKPTHIVACFDRKEPTFRHKAFKAYQAQRPPTEKDLSSQFEKAKSVLTAMNIPIFEMAGYEADDIIGTIAEQSIGISNSEILISKQIPNPKLQIPNKRNNTPNTIHRPQVEEVVIVTGDKDQFQLVNDNVKLYMPVTGLSNAKLMGEEEIIEKMGVKPEQIPDFKALVGDPSDNYKGVAGIGPKTASDLLIRFGTLKGVYENLDKIAASVREKLEKDKDNAELSLKLAKIVTDVLVEFDLKSAGMWRVDDPQVLALFSQFGFKTLTNRVKEVGKAIVSENQIKLL